MHSGIGKGKTFLGAKEIGLFLSIEEKFCITKPYLVTNKIE